MKLSNFKKYLYGAFFIGIFTVSLYVSVNYSGNIIDVFKSYVYAATKTASSSTSTKSSATGNDMTDLLVL